jgi:Uma2 family endonuclease
MSVSTLQTRRWTRQEYDRMAKAGLFKADERVELLDGEIAVMTPQASPHSVSIGMAERTLQHLFGPAYWVRVQMPLIGDPDSEPEPDLAVVPGEPRAYLQEHPRSAVLVVEVSDTTLSLDRDRKGPIYSRAGIPEYWIVNLVERTLEVYRDPLAHRDRPPRYQILQCLSAADRIAPLAKPDVPVRGADLLP